ncbi:phage tail protein [Sphingobium sp. WCS2017Hpa-17]|uniref:phage tail protein n=1 Tax=Sphingobium sp. WCS2017Hpa-17 TaxID=3073638 RepID=UPI0028899F6B|nr:phage tail protein [Sphingobium sp. WCS2017Hpa-17]
MRKADSLRRWLTAYLPYLKTHPDRLNIYVEGGSIATRKSRTLSFVYRYTLKVGIWEYAGDSDHIMVPILAWIEKEQRELLHRENSEAFQFEAELLDSDISDIEISIELTEPVLVVPRADGSGYDIEHPPEPEFPAAFAGVTASFQEAFANDEPIL